MTTTDQGKPRFRVTYNESGPGAVIRPGRVLITGGAGFIGTNVAAHFASAGCEVIVLDNLSRPGVERNLQWLRTQFDGKIKFEKGDIRDAKLVHKLVKCSDVVFHFAAQVAVTTSLENPEVDFAVNAGGTLNVLEACRCLSSPPALLFTSTNKVYGNLAEVSLIRKGRRYVPADDHIARHGISETCPLDFHSPYGCSKGSADQYVIDYARCWNLPAIVFRMSCIYGPHQFGTEDQGWVAHFARRVLDHNPIAVYGDGCQVRDLLFVEDLVAAMAAAVKNIGVLRSHVFNVGGGPTNAISVREVIEKIEKLHGLPITIRNGDWRQGDQRYYVSDCRRIRHELGWTPRVGVVEGIERLYEWLRSQSARLPAAI